MKVLDTHKFENKKLLQIEFDDGYKVSCTPEHKFFIDGEWVEAKDLVIDNEVTCIWLIIGIGVKYECYK